jgi:hypothetical protein
MRILQKTVVERTDSGLYAAKPYIPSQAVGLCIDQVLERDGHRSCFLTSSLNGLILRGMIDAGQAEHAQEVLNSDPRYADHWIAQRDHAAWVNSARRTSRAIGSVLGVEVDIQSAKSSDLGDALAAGRAVIVTDLHHCRTAFQSDVNEAVICDPNPNRVQESGHYDVEEIGDFHLDIRPIAII